MNDWLDNIGKIVLGDGEGVLRRIFGWIDKSSLAACEKVIFSAIC